MNTFCSYYNKNQCLSCDLIANDYSTQLQLKESTIKEVLKLKEIAPTETGPQKEFRNKIKLTVTGSIENPIIGLLGTQDFDIGRELENCPLHKTNLNQILPSIKEFIKLAKLSPYSIKNKKGELKGVILFQAEISKEIYLRFILRSKESVDRIKNNLNFLYLKHPLIKCVTSNIQPIAHAILEGDEEIYLSERHFIYENIGGFKIKIYPRAFVQTNQEVAIKLYKAASCWLEEIKPKKFLELYSGQGLFSFFSANHFQDGLGLEINEHAVNAANESAMSNHLNHLKFKCIDANLAENEITQFNPDIILVNPPRRGLDKSIDFLLRVKVKNIIYSSCSYQSLAKDIENLSSIYQIDRIQIFDMFPHTNHFETLVLLSLKHS